jgi:hypothetical protein
LQLFAIHQSGKRCGNPKFGHLIFAKLLFISYFNFNNLKIYFIAFEKKIQFTILSFSIGVGFTFQIIISIVGSHFGNFTPTFQMAIT